MLDRMERTERRQVSASCRNHRRPGGLDKREDWYKLNVEFGSSVLSCCKNVGAMKTSRMLLLKLARLAIAGSLVILSAHAQSQAIRLEPVLQGLSFPVLVTHARDGSKRQFVVEQTGRILVRAAGASTT